MMMAPKGSLLPAEVKRRNLYLAAIVLVLSCGGPEVPPDLPQAMEWQFNEPQPDWKVVAPDIPTFVPSEVSFIGDALRVTLTEQISGEFRGGIYIDLPDLDFSDWDTVVVRVRTQVEFRPHNAGFNLRGRSGPSPIWDRPFERMNWAPGGGC